MLSQRNGVIAQTRRQPELRFYLVLMKILH